MLHHYLKEDTSGDHWGVSSNTLSGVVLVQVQEKGEQVRVPLTVEQARQMRDALDHHLLLVLNAQNTKGVGHAAESV